MNHPEVAIRWADLCYEIDHAYELKYGPFGIVLEKNGDRISQITPPAGQSVDEFRYKHSPAVSMPLAIPEIDYNRFVLANNMVRKNERYQLYSKFFPAANEVFPTVYFTAEEDSELATLRTDVTDYVNQMKAKFVTGAESIETGWDTYVQTLNRAGLARYLEIYQKALDRYNSN
jgi:putative aldouronate transport system substrate-binding protein